MAKIRDSGIEWLGNIPEHWKICRVKNIFSLRSEKNYLPLSNVQLLSLYTDIGVFKHGEFEAKGNKAVTAEGYKEVYPDDIIVNIILAWMGAIGRSDYRGVTSPAYDIYCPEKNICSRFYHYLFRTTGFAGECYKYGRGIMEMRWRTYSAEFRAIKIPLPPFAEQKKIADFLDKKCSAIDSAVDAAKKLVEKLREYKKSLITETVTKGLNLSTEMQETNIEWIGEIPEHWKIGKLKNLITLQRGYDLPSEKFVEGDFPIYGSSGLMGYHNQKTSTAPNIVIGRSGSTGKLHYIEKNFWAHNTGIFISDRKENYCKYLYYLLNVVDMDSLSTKTAVPTLDRKKIQEYRVPYTTDISEQKEIADFLDKKCAAIDENISKREKLIEKLSEYKKSLIYKVVTGKVEV